MPTPFQPAGYGHQLRVDELDWAASPHLHVGGDVVAPHHPGLMGSATAALSANDMRFVRVRAHRTGVLRDIYAFVVATNTTSDYDTAVLDVGGTASGTWTVLYSLGATSMTAFTANSWVKLADPKLAVTAGQELVLAVSTTSTTVTFGSVNSGALPHLNAAVLPSRFGPTVDNANNVFQGGMASKHPIVTTLQSSMGGIVKVPYLMARITGSPSDA